MSSDYLQTKARRAAQFARYIRLMDDRAHEIATSSCMLIISDSPGQDSSTELTLEVEVAVKQPSALQMGGLPGAMPLPEDGEAEDAWRPDASGPQRFVQFSFEEDWFCLDMPNSTLNRADGARIIRDRTGFFWLKDRQEFTLKDEDVEGWNPFRKIYIYGDEETAGGDTAHIFFAVWNFPVDTTLYVTAASFNGEHRWEDSYPIS